MLHNCWCFRNLAKNVKTVNMEEISHYLQGFIYISGGAGCFPSTVPRRSEVLEVWGSFRRVRHLKFVHSRCFGGIPLEFQANLISQQTGPEKFKKFLPIQKHKASRARITRKMWLNNILDATKIRVESWKIVKNSGIYPPTLPCLTYPRDHIFQSLRKRTVLIWDFFT